MKELQVLLVDMLSYCIGKDHYNINLILNSNDIISIGFQALLIEAGLLN